MSLEQNYFAHESAVIDPGAEIGANAKVWHFCHLSSGCKIGESCTLGQNVFVAENVELGARTKVQNNVSLYSGVHIEEDVFLGPSCVFTNMSNPRSEVNRQQLYEDTLVMRGASIGANSTILCGVTIGRFAFVGAGSVVTKDVPDYGLIRGAAAVQVGWMSRHGHPLHFDSTGLATCRESGLRYRRNENAVSCMDLPESEDLPVESSVARKKYRDF